MSKAAGARAPWIAAGTLAAYLASGSRTPATAEAAGAGEDPQGRPPGQQPVLRFDIPAGSLDAVLASFESASGWAVRRAIPADILGGIESPGVTGVLTPTAALDRLLAGTVTGYRHTGPEAVVVELRVRDTVEVTAPLSSASPKYTEPLRDIPQTITVVPRAVMDAQNATTLRDVLRNVTGITIQAGEGGVPAGDNLSIRGFSARTDILIDGVRDSGGYSRDPFNVDQVEVAKGPSSSIAGRGSTGGAINLVTKTPHLQRSRTLAFGAGTSEYLRGTADFNQPLPSLGDGAAVRLNLLWNDTDTPGRDEVTSRRWGVAPSLALGAGTPTRTWITYSHLDQDNVPDYGIPWVPVNTGPLAEFSGMRPPVSASNFYGLLARDFEDTTTDVATAQVEHDFGARATLRQQVRYGRNDRDSVITAPRFAAIASETDFTRINRNLQSRDMLDTILSSQTTATTRFRTGPVAHALVAGLDLTRERSRNFLRTGPAAPQADLFEPDPAQPYAGPIARTGAVNDGEADGVAAYAFDTVEVSRKLELSAGVRYDRFSATYEQTAVDGVVTAFDRSDDVVSGRGGVVYKPRPQGSIYAGFGTSYNPSAESLALTAATVLIGPERTRAFEVGTKWDLLSGRLSLNGAAFRVEKTNARTPGLDAGDPPQVLDGEHRVQGFEVGAAGTLWRRVSLFAGYAHMTSEIEASNTAEEIGNALAQTPEDTFNLWATVRLGRGVEVGGGLQYMDSVYRNAVNTLQAPGYWLASATAAYEVNRRLTLRINATNLADEDYVDRVGGGHFIPGAGRQATLTANVRF